MFQPVVVTKWHFAERDGDSESFLLKVSAFSYLPSSKAVGGSRRIYPPVPGGAERGRGGGCCLVQVAGWMERKDAAGVTSWGGNGNFVSLSFSGNRITLDYMRGQGRSGSKGNKERLTNSWRQARKTEMLEQTGRDKIKTIYLQVFPGVFLVMWWAFCLLCFVFPLQKLSWLCSLSDQRCLMLPHIPRHRPCAAPCPVQQSLFNSCWSDIPGCQTATGN